MLRSFAVVDTGRPKGGVLPSADHSGPSGAKKEKKEIASPQPHAIRPSLAIASGTKLPSR
jgi:hypothetical protein